MSPEEDQNIRLQRTRSDVTEPEAFKERFGVDRVEDRQLQAAVDILNSFRLLEERTPAPAAPAASPPPAKVK
jgi:carboxyl-terminal processing protease